MKILILSEYFPISEKSEITGGVEARAFYLAKELSLKNQVFVLTSWQKGLERKKEFVFFEKNKKKIKKFFVFRIGKNHPYTNNAGFFSRISFASELVKFGLNFKNIDIIDAHNFTTYLPGYKIAKKLNKKIIFTYHETWLNEWIKNKGVIAFPYEIYERLILKLNYDGIISVSNFTKNRLIKNKVSEKKIFVINNGIDLKIFDNINKNFKKNEKEKNSLIYVGRLIETKKVDVIIKALKIIKEKIPNVKLKIIGKGNEEEKLKKLVFDLRLKENVSFLGYMKNHYDVLKEIKKSDLFLSASILEGFGIALLEAMALKIPYVCSDIEPFKEINNKKGGLFFKKQDHMDLANKALILLENKKSYEKKIKEVDNLKKFDWKNIALSVEKVYKKIIEDRN
ncbi:MAG: glycosyltransferase family 4 protein [Candidatus Woesearchaeota archaeon]